MSRPPRIVQRTFAKFAASAAGCRSGFCGERFDGVKNLLEEGELVIDVSTEVGGANSRDGGARGVAHAARDACAAEDLVSPLSCPRVDRNLSVVMPAKAGIQ